MTDQIQHIREALTSADVTERRVAARNAHQAIDADPAALFACLCDSLNDDPVWSVREAAAESIGELGIRCPTELGDTCRRVLLAASLFDASELVREGRRRDVLRLNLDWPETFCRLDEAWTTERNHIRRRVLRAYSDFAVHRDPTVQFGEAVSGGHFKLRITALVELRRHPAILRSLLDDVVRRCFDHHSVVALQAVTTIDEVRAELPDEVANALQSGRIADGPQAVLSVLLSSVTEPVRSRFESICRERLAWYQRIGRQTDDLQDAQALELMIAACVAIAERSQQPQRNTRREYAWLLGKLCGILSQSSGLSRDGIAPPSPR